MRSSLTLCTSSRTYALPRRWRKSLGPTAGWSGESNRRSDQNGEWWCWLWSILFPTFGEFSVSFILALRPVLRIIVSTNFRNRAPSPNLVWYVVVQLWIYIIASSLSSFIPAIAPFAFFTAARSPLTYNPIAHSLIHGRLRAPTAMISPGAVCNFYCMFLWQRGREGEVIPRSCSAAIFPRGNCGTRGKEKRKLCFGPPATQNRIHPVFFMWYTVKFLISSHHIHTDRHTDKQT